MYMYADWRWSFFDRWDRLMTLDARWRQWCAPATSCFLVCSSWRRRRRRLTHVRRRTPRDTDGVRRSSTFAGEPSTLSPRLAAVSSQPPTIARSGATPRRRWTTRISFQRSVDGTVVWTILQHENASLGYWRTLTTHRTCSSTLCCIRARKNVEWVVKSWKLVEILRAFGGASMEQREPARVGQAIARRSAVRRRSAVQPGRPWRAGWRGPDLVAACDCWLARVRDVVGRSLGESAAGKRKRRIDVE